MERVLARSARVWTPVRRGYTRAERWLVDADDGSRAFVKAATDDSTASWLRAEHRVYAAAGGAAFLPRMIAFEDGALPVLVLEDLRDAHWPPPWSPARIAALMAALDAMARVRGPDALDDLESQRPFLSGWTRVAADPAPFLSLSLCSEAWLRTALPALLDAQSSAVLEGESLVHGDLRSDNVAFVGDRAVLVDWNWACRGNARVDLAWWLPSLEAEGGPPPEALLPHEPALAALVAGFFAAEAGLEPGDRGVRVRALQRTQLRRALPWAVRALGLAPLDE